MTRAAYRVTKYPSLPNAVPVWHWNSQILGKALSPRQTDAIDCLAETLKYTFYLAINVSRFNASYTLSFSKLDWLRLDVSTAVPINSRQRMNDTPLPPAIEGPPLWNKDNSYRIQNIGHDLYLLQSLRNYLWLPCIPNFPLLCFSKCTSDSQSTKISYDSLDHSRELGCDRKW